MTREEQAAALLAEAHAMLDRHARERIAYYSHPGEVSRELLDVQHASEVALDEIVGAIARQVELPFVNLEEAMATQKNGRVFVLLEDVLARVKPISTSVDAAA
jgi:transcriptional regulatory protein LevR